MAAPAGGVSLPLAIAALNVASGATVTFGAQTLTPTEPTPCVGASACVLQVQVPSSAIATSQAVPVSITNPGASGGTSAPQSFLVINMSQFPTEDSVNNASPPVAGNGASYKLFGVCGWGTRGVRFRGDESGSAGYEQPFADLRAQELLWRHSQLHATNYADFSRSRRQRRRGRHNGQPAAGHLS